MNSKRNDARWAGCNTRSGVETLEQAATVSDAVYEHIVLDVLREVWIAGGSESLIKQLERIYGIEFYP